MRISSYILPGLMLGATLLGCKSLQYTAGVCDCNPPAVESVLAPPARPAPYGSLMMPPAVVKTVQPGYVAPAQNGVPVPVNALPPAPGVPVNALPAAPIAPGHVAPLPPVQGNVPPPPPPGNVPAASVMPPKPLDAPATAPTVPPEIEAETKPK